MTRPRPFLHLALGLGVLAPALFFVGCTSPSKTPPQPSQQSPAPATARGAASVRVETVKQVRLPRTLELSGTVKAHQVAILATKVSGRITDLTVQEGNRVMAGQVLARVDTSAISAQARQAEAGVEVAVAASRERGQAVIQAETAIAGTRARVRQMEAQLQEAQAAERQAQIDQKRVTFLFKGDGVPRADLDRANTALSVARARVSSLRASLAQSRADVRVALANVDMARVAHSQTQASVELARAGVGVAAADLPYGILRAPFSGAVTRKLANQGDMASPGQPILEIQDVDHLHLEVSTPEESLRYLLPGQRVRVRVDALDRESMGEVYQVVPSADPKTRTFVVKIRLPRDPKLFPGLYAKAQVGRGTRMLMIVPQTALVRRGQLVNVFVVNDDRARLRLVKVGEPQAGGGVEVLSGLSAGDRVIMNPPGDLEDGSPVKMTSPAARLLEDRHVSLR